MKTLTYDESASSVNSQSLSRPLYLTLHKSSTFSLVHASELSFGTPTSGKIPGSYNPLTMLFAASRAVVILRSYFYINFLFKKDYAESSSLLAGCCCTLLRRETREQTSPAKSPCNNAAKTDDDDTNGNMFPNEIFPSGHPFHVSGWSPAFFGSRSWPLHHRQDSGETRQASKQAGVPLLFRGGFVFISHSFMGRLLLCVG